jgi:signal transduction histidine kinase
MKRQSGTVRRKSIKARMLAIVLIPSLALLLIGLGISGFLVAQGIQTNQWAANLQSAVDPGTRIVGNLQLERWLSLVQVGGGKVDAKQLAAQRAKVNADIGTMSSTISSMPDLAKIVPSGSEIASSPWAQLPRIRQEVDSGRISLIDTYTYYDQLLAPIASYVSAVAGQAPNAEIANAQLTAAALYSATEDVARANALAFSAAIKGGLNGAEFAEYSRQVGAYQSSVAALVPQMTPAEQQRYAALIASPAWRQLASVQDALSARGPAVAGTSPAVPLAVSQVDWQNDTLQVTGTMLSLFTSHFHHAADIASSDGHTTLIRALVAGLLIILIGIAVLAVALRMSNGVVRRLTSLRKDTLDLADHHLPRIVEQLRSGAHVDVGQEVPVLQHGRDEIGQVAEAFNKAQHTAVSAAVQEAKTRQGANEVFLNIAHRSQVVAHRQLSVLDLAEHRQEDPQQVQFLFQLDHLATRARRNAENLIILGGRRPSRQWRDAVPIRDVVRSAIAETEHFARIKIARLPAVAVVGPGVADVVHLLAELLDNATAFAPPDARAEVRGNLVGRGAMIEIEDQGLGIPPEIRDAINASLSTPPDYGVMALTSDARLGLFVVARLAARHGIRVTLTESAYGGTRAIVLLPTQLIESAAEPLGVDGPAADGADSPVNGRANGGGIEETVGTRSRTTMLARPTPGLPEWPNTEPVDATAPEPTVALGNGHALSNGSNGHAPSNGNGVNGNGNGNGSSNVNGNGAVLDGDQPTIVTAAVPEPPADDLTADELPADELTAGDLTAGDPPPLPRRRRHSHLAPQLAAMPAAARDEDGWRSAEHVRDAISAFQRGTHRARDAGDGDTVDDGEE